MQNVKDTFLSTNIDSVLFKNCVLLILVSYIPILRENVSKIQLWKKDIPFECLASSGILLDAANKILSLKLNITKLFIFGRGRRLD